MKPIALTLLMTALLLPFISKAQNLVPNGSFELKNNCPSNLVSIPYSAGYSTFPTVTHWTSPVKNSTPDYFNTCAAIGSGLKVPFSQFGYQEPHTGDAYAGIILWEGQLTPGGTVSFDYREYLQTKLTQPLQAGRQYCISFLVSPTINTAFNLNYIWLDEIGINLAPQRPTDTQKYSLALNYQVRNKPGNYITDSAGWFEVRGNYTATGGEEWLTLGCFHNNGNNPPPYLLAYPAVPNPGVSYRSYMFIEDIAITEITSADTQRLVHDTLVCKSTGNNISLNVSPGAETYVWSTGATGTTITAQDTGTYWCRSNLVCGQRIDSFHIRFQPQQLVSLGDDTVNCQNQPVTIQANNNYTSYLWNTGATTSSITVSQSGTYILTVSDTCGLQKDTVDVTIQPPTAPPLVSDTMICQGVLNPQLNVSGTNLLWYRPGLPFGGAPVQLPVNTAVPGTEHFLVSQTVGKCESPRVPLEVTVKYKPAPDIGNYYFLCKDYDTVIGKSYPDVTYLWNTSEQVCCIKPRNSGYYLLTISNECGTASDTAYVELSPCDECMTAPNAFTPNGDGKNDIFRPITKCPVTNYRFEVFNRWGELVFATNDPEQGWDGRVKGENADAGVYVFVLNYRSVNSGYQKLLNGNLTLIR